MYHFEHTNHGIRKTFLFQTLSSCVYSVSVLCLSDYRKLFFPVMMFHLFFLNHPCIYMNKHLFAVIK